jgi:polysaccharide biosynthesis/export protein
MRYAALLLVLLSLSAATFAEQATDPFRVVKTPAGCAVIFDQVPSDYRVEALVNGAVLLSIEGVGLPVQERILSDQCLKGYRISPTAGGSGTSIEISPVGVEFAGVIHSKGNLQVLFEKVVNLATFSGDADAGAASRSYRLGIGDVLKVTVYNHEDLTKELTVGNDGSISYSLIGEFQAAGKTAREVQDFLASALGKDYIVNPQVSVEVKTYASQYVYVNGPVKQPGRIPLQGGLTLKDALSLAGGFATEAGTSVTVARKSADPDKQDRGPEKLRFSREEIDMGLANVELIPGDVVTVAEKDYVYIQSEVREPGKYEIGPDGLTLLRAIAVAKGLTDWADPKHVGLIRVVGGQTIRETYNLRNIERQKAPDVDLMAGDIIIVRRRLL